MKNLLNKTIKIGIVGTRGIPANYGGFETFAQEVSPELVKKGFIVNVYCDKNGDKDKLDNYKGVKLKYLRVTKSSNPLWFYFFGIQKGLKENDIILVTGTGGAFFYFLNLFYRKKIITNTDGVESRRAKWSFFKRLFIKSTEKLAVRFSHGLVADSKGITKYIQDTYNVYDRNKLKTIEYGAFIKDESSDPVLKKYNLKHKDYFLVVARLEPENNIHTIVNGFIKSGISKKLVVIGNLTENKYVSSLLSKKNRQIHFIGGVYNPSELSALRCSAFAYVHGHSVGGTNPSLLEAMGSGNLCICHDNIFNREVTNNRMLYFDSSQSCAESIMQSYNISNSEYVAYEEYARSRIVDYYNWENIACKYASFFKNLNK